MRAISCTIGEPANDLADPLGTPFKLPLILAWLGHPLQSRSRSEPSKPVEDDVAESWAIFCRAFRRIFLGILRPLN